MRTYQGLCPKCYAERRRPISPPEFLDLVRCSTCSRMLIGKRWVKGDIESAIIPLLDENVVTAKEVRFRTFTFDARREDERNLTITVKAILRVDDMELLKSFTTRLRVHGGACPTCGKRAGHYYEAILQVRAEGRILSPDETEEVVEFAERSVDRAAETGEAFISEIEPVRGGVDIYLSAHELGRNIAKELRAKYGGSVGVSSKLFGLKDGKEVYRTTHLMRLPRYRVGDVVSLDKELYEVLSMGQRPLLGNLGTRERKAAASGMMEKAKIVPSERLVADVLAVTESEVEYSDPTSSKTARARKPPNFEESDTVEIVKVEGRAFVSLLRRVGGKMSR